MFLLMNTTYFKKRIRATDTDTHTDTHRQTHTDRHTHTHTHTHTHAECILDSL